MKIINAKILIIIILINMLLPLSAFSKGIITLYNHDEEVYLNNDIEIYNNHYYISVEDLYELELDWEFSDSLYIESYYNDLIIYPETSIIELNGNSMLFQNPMKDIDGIKYVSLDLISMVFSGIYEIRNNSIFLWINTGGAYTARGTISLPNDEVAPVGGIEILVFYGRQRYLSHESGFNYSEDISGLEMGYSGISKPITANDEIEYSIHKYAEKYVTIPEGKNSVEYALGIPYVYSKGYLGYEVDTDAYKETYTEEFYRNSGMVNFEIYSNTVTLSGTVTLPEIAEKDVNFSVYSEVYTERMYSYEGIISAGTDFASYSMQVGKYDDYSLSVVFEDNEYKRIFKEETITVKDTEVINIDFETQKSNIVSGILKLPDNIVLEEDVEVTVTIQSKNSPNYYLDTETVVIAAGDTSESFTLYDDMGCGDVICFYELKSVNVGLFSFGHYSETGTTVINDNASVIAFDENVNRNIEITLTKNTPVELRIILPDGYVAESNIYGNIYLANAYEQGEYIALMSSSAGAPAGGGGASSKPSSPVPAIPLFKKGENEVVKTFNIPDDDGFKYNIVLHGIDDANDMFYDVTYYKGDGATTVFRECAKGLTSSDSSVELTLMKQHKISGKIATDVVCDVGRVYAIYQADSEINEDVKNTEFKVLTEPDRNNNFELFVPDEFDDYIFRFDIYGKTVYYSSAGLAETIGDAEVVAINDDTNIEILYEGFNPEPPLVITYHDINNDMYGTGTTVFDGYIKLKNISDYEYECDNFHIASYDETGRLLHIEALPTLLINPHDYSKKYKLDNYIDNKASCVKIFAWSDNLKPLAGSYEISTVVEDTTVDYRNAYLWMQAGKTSMYFKGKEYSLDVAPFVNCDVFYAPLRVIAETFGASSEFDSDTQIISILLDDKVVKIQMNTDMGSVNGEEYQLKGQPIVINGRTLLPIADLAEIFGFNGEYISKTYEFVIHDKKLAYSDVHNSHPYFKAITELSEIGIFNGFEDGTFKPEMGITRAELSKLICNVVDTDASTTEFSCGDVDTSHWAARFIGYCVLNDIISLEDGLFRPSSATTVSETISALLNLKGFNGNGANDEIVGVAEDCGLLNNLLDFELSEAITRGEMAQLLYNSLELDSEKYYQRKFLEMCNSGTYNGIFGAINSELYEYSFCEIIRTLDSDDKREIAKIIYSECRYFDSVDSFDKYVEISYREWKALNEELSSGGVGGGGDSSGNKVNSSNIY